MSGLARAKPVAFILTRDRTAAKPFYSETLGLRLLWEDDFAAVYDVGGIKLRLTTVDDHQPAPHAVLGWEVPDIVATVRALSGKGVDFAIYPGLGQDALGIWTAPDGTSKVAFFNDSEGNVLSLTEA